VYLEATMKYARSVPLTAIGRVLERILWSIHASILCSTLGINLKMYIGIYLDV